MPTLSKSKYTTACQCLKALWLRTYKKEVETIDVSLQTRLAAGNEVGNLAKSFRRYNFPQSRRVARHLRYDY